MHLSHRPYDDLQHDFARMWRFLLDDYAYRQDQFIWLVSRFGDWKYGLWSERKFFPTFFRNNAHLWFDGRDELLGFVISESGDELFTIFTRRGYDFLYREILGWVTCNWGDREKLLKTEIRESQLDAIAHLERAGFASRGQVAVTRQFRVCDKAAEPIVLPKELRIEDCLTNTDDLGKRRLRGLAFRNTYEVRDVDLMALTHSHECPCYFPQYDLSVVAADGTHVSSCVGYVDFEHRIAEIEVVCTHPDFRRRGLAEAVIRACFKRLAQDGIEVAYITGYGDEAIGLYGKLGHIHEGRWLLYEATSNGRGTP